jgi:hypothetical protein
MWLALGIGLALGLILFVGYWALSVAASGFDH